MTPIFRKYRPQSFAEFIGNEMIVRRLVALERRTGFGGRSLWLSGLSGTGKTSLAHIVAASVADEFGIEEIDAGQLTPARLADIERSMNTYAIGSKPGRAYLVDEAHGLRKDTIRQLLVTLERLPSHVTWVFTTTDRGERSLFDGIDAHPLLSRCIKLELTTDGLAYAFAERAQQIARAEGLDFGATIDRYHALVVECSLNFRDVLNQIEAGYFMDFATESTEPARASRTLLVGRR